MKKKLLLGTLLMVFAIGVSVTSCSKDDNNSSTPGVSDTTNTGNGNDNPTDTIGGGGNPSNNNLMPTTFPDKKIQSIDYNDGEKLYEFEWDGNKLEKIDYTAGNTKREYRLIYENDRVIKTEKYVWAGNDWYYLGSFDYNYDGSRIVSESYSSPHIVADPTIYEYTWFNGRPSKITRTDNGNVFLVGQETILNKSTLLIQTKLTIILTTTKTILYIFLWVLNFSWKVAIV